MNEQFQKLMNQAIQECKPDDKPSKDKTLQRFAELIINECAKVADVGNNGGIMEMKQTIADKEAEIERLTKKCDMQANILRRLTPDKFPDTIFISGVLGERDSNNMPQKLLVVPAYGVDFSYIYERTEKTTGPEW